jgi:nitrate reductase assembly molybdenum cofactor insertion protein NarJ
MTKLSNRARFEKLLGPDKLAEKMGALFGVNAKEMFRWERGEWPAYTSTFLEFMETVPQDQWPRRFLSLIDHTKSK